jgi:hypothetical protein
LKIDVNQIVMHLSIFKDGPDHVEENVFRLKVPNVGYWNLHALLVLLEPNIALMML